MAKLLQEINEDVRAIVEEVLEEGTNNKMKNYFIEGIFMQTELQNRNGRVYPKAIVSPVITNYIKEQVRENRAFGELGHPDTPSIKLERASHLIKSLSEDGNNYIGKAKIINTPNGNIVKAMIDEGAKLGVSSRGVGTLVQQRDGSKHVSEDFKLSTAGDIVADPSAPDAFVRGIMEESEWLYDEKTNMWRLSEQVKKTISKLSSKQLEERKLHLFEQFLRNFK